MKRRKVFDDTETRVSAVSWEQHGAPEYRCAMKDIRVLDDDITDRSHG
jgi:hypothetical protein